MTENANKLALFDTKAGIFENREFAAIAIGIALGQFFDAQKLICHGSTLFDVSDASLKQAKGRVQQHADNTDHEN